MRLRLCPSLLLLARTARRLHLAAQVEAATAACQALRSTKVEPLRAKVRPMAVAAKCPLDDVQDEGEGHNLSGMLLRLLQRPPKLKQRPLNGLLMQGTVVARASATTRMCSITSRPHHHLYHQQIVTNYKVASDLTHCAKAEAGAAAVGGAEAAWKANGAYTGAGGQAIQVQLQ